MKDLSIIKSNLSNFLEILKAKRREEGEVWTQPSGRKVTKKNGKIVPVSEGKKQPKEKTNEKNSKSNQEKENEVVEIYIKDRLRQVLQIKGLSKEQTNEMSRTQLEKVAKKYFGKQVDALLKKASQNIHKDPKYKKMLEE